MLKKINYKQILLRLSLILLTSLILWLMGRVLICKCGYVKFWHGITNSSENSQHLTDWYTFSHIIHGFAFYYLLKYLFPRMSSNYRWLIAIGLESSWEIIENTEMVINHYRTATISLDYYGDSVINATFDILSMVFGYYLAIKLPTKVIILLTLAMEIFVGYMIRDNLTLNILMFIYPAESIKNWQMNI